MSHWRRSRWSTEKIRQTAAVEPAVVDDETAVSGVEEERVAGDIGGEAECEADRAAAQRRCAEGVDRTVVDELRVPVGRRVDIMRTAELAGCAIRHGLGLAGGDRQRAGDQHRVIPHGRGIMAVEILGRELGDRRSDKDRCPRAVQSLGAVGMHP